MSLIRLIKLIKLELIYIIFLYTTQSRLNCHPEKKETKSWVQVKYMVSMVRVHSKITIISGFRSFENVMGIIWRSTWTIFDVNF
jgi:hypothetical protein